MIIKRKLLKCGLHKEEGGKKSVFRNYLGKSTMFDIKSLALMSSVSPTGNLGTTSCYLFLNDWLTHSRVT